MAAFTLLGPTGASADHALPSLDPSTVDYTPIGHYGPTDRGGESATIPQPGDVPEVGPNPSGKYVAYDTNVWESHALPSRHPGDNCNSLPEDEQHELCSEGDRDADNDGPSGTGSAAFGFCPNPLVNGFIAGECQNNQLEYLDYYEQTMQEMLADFGVVTHRYPFESPGRSDGGTGRGGYLDAAPGTGWNVSATVAGADHPEETVLVSGHYDFTDSGPAAAWDSAEGHTEVIRMAKIMSDYWRATGTRPSATVKFIPWDSEESGTFGSIDYVENNIPPDEEEEVRGYFNVDPCAGAYPAFRNGNPTNRVPEVVQLADPAAYPEDSPERARIEAFNALASNPDSDDDWVDQTLDRLDDTLAVGAGDPVPIFVSDREAAEGENGGDSQRDEIATALGGLLIFSSDYANFADAGIPIFNLFPDYFGPHADGTPASSEGIGILHTPRDNLSTINALTSADQTGLQASEGWAKGMEMCAQMEAWAMLQPQMGGAQTSNGDVVAYFEALPNEAIVRQKVQFDAGGSYKYADVAGRTLAGDLSYQWDFGDGSTGTGRTVEHRYTEVGRYIATLTVTSASGGSDTMTLPIVVIPSNFVAPILDPVNATDAKDGNFPLTWEFTGDRDGFDHFSVEESRDLAVLVDDDASKLESNFTASTPTNAAIDPWQASDSDTQKNRGNLFRSEPRSFYTGVGRANHEPGMGPNDGESILELNRSLTLPLGSTTLTYFSDFANDANDAGRVEAALDDGDANTPLEWEPIDTLGLDERDRDTMSVSEEPVDSDANFELRLVELGRFAGKTIRLRWVYDLGDAQFVNVYRMGWYVDDIEIHIGTFTPIGTTTSKNFEVFGKPTGTYAYRIRGVYTDEIETAPSNVETVQVTQGAPAPSEPPPDVAPCTRGRGFRSVRVKPFRDGLRVRVRRAAKRKFRVVVRRHTAGQRVLRRSTRVATFRKRSKSFTWRPQGTLRAGYYSVGASMRVTPKRRDVRQFALRRGAERFRKRPKFARRTSCRTLRYARLSGPAFGGRNDRALGIAFRLRRPAEVSLRVARGKRVVRTYAPVIRAAGTNYRLKLPAASLPRGEYRVKVIVASGASKKRVKLRARKL
jgi:PKD repeat protein/Zn-dependent M28 family amino/carboxypeptidase